MLYHVRVLTVKQTNDEVMVFLRFGLLQRLDAMRWFQKSTDSPRLLSLSPLRHDGGDVGNSSPPLTLDTSFQHRSRIGKSLNEQEVFQLNLFLFCSNFEEQPEMYNVWMKPFLLTQLLLYFLTNV